MNNKSILDKPIDTGTGGTGDIATPDDGEVHLTPKTTSTTGAEGTMFYSSIDNHVYVGTEA